jgi:hypothetical protein
LVKAFWFRNGKTVCIAERPIEPLIERLSFSQRQHQASGSRDQSPEEWMKIPARVFTFLTNDLPWPVSPAITGHARGFVVIFNVQFYEDAVARRVG